mgnify:CR=1 FL=1
MLKKNVTPLPPVGFNNISCPNFRCDNYYLMSAFYLFGNIAFFFKRRNSAPTKRHFRNQARLLFHIFPLYSFSSSFLLIISSILIHINLKEKIYLICREAHKTFTSFNGQKFSKCSFFHIFFLPGITKK